MTITEFDAEVREKKGLARQAKHHKVGSKSRKVTLGSDRLSKKQWLERCGPVMSYQLNKPVRWVEFKSYPKDIAEQYLRGITERFHPTSRKIAEMLGVSVSTLDRYCRAAGLSIDTRRGARMSEEDLLAFNDFMKGEFGEHNHPDTEAETAQIQEQKADAPVVKTQKEGSTEARNMKMTGFEMTFSGPFNPNGIYNTLSQAVAVGTMVNVKVVVEVLE